MHPVKCVRLAYGIVTTSVVALLCGAGSAYAINLNKLKAVPSIMTGTIFHVAPSGGAICDTVGTAITGEGLQLLQQAIKMIREPE